MLPEPVSTLRLPALPSVSVTSPEPVSSLRLVPCIPETVMSPDPVSSATSPAAGFRLEARALHPGDRDAARSGLERDVPRGGAHVDVSRAGRNPQRALRPRGRDVRRRDRHTQRAVDVRDRRLTDAEIEPDALAGGNGHVQVGVGFQSTAAPRDPDLAAFVEAVAAALGVAERAVVAHAQGGVPAAAPTGQRDDVVGIDDAQRLAAAYGPRLNVELRRVGAAALDFDDHVAAGTGIDPELTDEVVHGDGIAFEDVTRSLCGDDGGSYNQGKCDDGRQRSSVHSGSTGSWLQLDSETTARVAALHLMKDWLVWFLLAIGLFVGEMFTAGFWLACLAVGAAVAGIVGLIPGLGFVAQGITFAVSSVVSMAGLRPRLMRLLQLGPGSELRTGVDALLGKTGTVTERIAPGRPGRVKVDGEDWRGASSDAAVLEPGTQVTVIQVDGTTLMVEKEL